RRATALGTLGEPHGAISTHALREEGDAAPFFRPHVHMQISTHALREEGDACLALYALALVCISTHALREEGDRPCENHSLRPVPHFYPRPPRGGRPQ